MASKIIAGLKEAVRHARCTNRHTDHHNITKISRTQYRVECGKCGHRYVVDTLPGDVQHRRAF